MRMTSLLKTIVPATLVIGLAACSAEPEEDVAYEADVVDESGGEMVVVPEDAEGVAVDLPETPMTPVAEGEAPISDGVTLEEGAPAE